MTGTDPAELVLSGAIELPRVLLASASESNLSANSITPAQRLYLSRNPVLARGAQFGYVGPRLFVKYSRADCGTVDLGGEPLNDGERRPTGFLPRNRR